MPAEGATKPAPPAHPPPSINTASAGAVKIPSTISLEPESSIYVATEVADPAADLESSINATLAGTVKSSSTTNLEPDSSINVAIGEAAPLAKLDIPLHPTRSALAGYYVSGAFCTESM